MMLPRFRIYLSGSIKKGAADQRGHENFWTPENENYIVRHLGDAVELLNPSKSAISRQDYLANFGCDLYLVKTSKAVLVDLRTEKGIGVGAELMYANTLGIPVVGWSPPESNYQRSSVRGIFGEDLVDWIHPFAFGMCDFLSPSLEEACQHLASIRDGDWTGRAPTKLAASAIDHFLALYPGFRDGE